MFINRSQEKQNLEALKEQVQRNSQLSEKMVDILTSFENRLGRLQQTILPIYNEMENLQLKKTSKTIQCVVLS